jgi:molybdate transport system substrate-binding protein
MTRSLPKRFFVLAALLACLATGPAGAAGEELVVSAAASLTNAFVEAGKAFESANPGTKVVLNFAASGTLLQQIDKGAPVDVFATADPETMDKAESRGLVDSKTRKNFARNRLVLIVPADDRTSLGGLADLSKAEVKRIAVGDPAFVPVGRYTEHALRAAGLLDALRPKLIPANSARQVLDYVSRGEVDAGFVYATDAGVAKDKVKIVAEPGGHDPIVYPIAVVAASGRRGLAAKFLGFVLGTEGRAILARYGFAAP